MVLSGCVPDVLVSYCWTFSLAFAISFFASLERRVIAAREPRGGPKEHEARPPSIIKVVCFTEVISVVVNAHEVHTCRRFAF